MGFDCTLHLVDERAIREEFVPRLLRRSRKQTALDRVLKNAKRLWDDVRKSLDSDDPETAASLLCQLAITFSACSLPHQYERGFALSLWQNQGKDIAVEYPARFAFSPEPLFTQVVELYPQLHDRFPTWFTGNYSTGVFIPSEHVSEVLAWAEKEIGQFAKGDRRSFKGLLGILRAAADKHLAYWEATDLAVPMANEYPGDTRLMIAHYLGNEPGTPGHEVEEAPLTGHFHSLGCAVIDHWLVHGDYSPFVTNFWDLSVWPPRLEYSLPEFSPDRAHSRDGRWLLFSETNPEARPRWFRPRLFSDLHKQPDATFPVAVDDTEVRVRSGGFIGDRLLVFREQPGTAKIGDLLPVPLWLEGKDWKPASGLPEVEARPSPGIRGEPDKPVVGIVRLADGGDVVVWNGDGYELRGNRFEKTFSMDARQSYIDWTSVPAGTDGYFYLSDRHLFEVHRHGKGTAHSRRWTNIMYVYPGPAGGILLKEGKNKDGDVAKLYFPADGTFIHIEPELFDDKDYPFIYWSPASDRFVVLAGKFLAVRTEVVLSLPRYRASTGRQVKG
jgi:hypothetical protein